MKHYLFKYALKNWHNILITWIALWCVGINSSCSRQSAKDEAIGSDNVNPIEGGWYLIRGEYGDFKREESQPFQFKVFSKEHYSFLMKTDDEAWTYGSAGSYEIDANIYKELCEFSTVPDYAGTYTEWRYELRGDTLIMEGPTKILDKEGKEAPELVENYNSMKEVRVRAKRTNLSVVSDE